jgi:hypothetical protein
LGYPGKCRDTIPQIWRIPNVDGLIDSDKGKECKRQGEAIQVAGAKIIPFVKKAG